MPRSGEAIGRGGPAPSNAWEGANPECDPRAGWACPQDSNGPHNVWEGATPRETQPKSKNQMRCKLTADRWTADAIKA